MYKLIGVIAKPLGMLLSLIPGTSLQLLSDRGKIPHQISVSADSGFGLLRTLHLLVRLRHSVYVRGHGRQAQPLKAASQESRKRPDATVAEPAFFCSGPKQGRVHSICRFCFRRCMKNTCRNPAT